MSTFARDTQYAVRTLRRTPGFTVAAVLVLGLGIGATTAIFSLVDAALLRPLPFRDADRLVKIFERAPQNRRNSVALLNFQDWRDQNHSFVTMAATGGGGLWSLSDGTGDIPEPVAVQNVTPGFFEVFGIAPMAGRTLRPRRIQRQTAHRPQRARLAEPLQRQRGDRRWNSTARRRPQHRRRDRARRF